MTDTGSAPEVLGARLGPSGAGRWLKCSLAPQLEKAQPHTDSQWAAEGTLMHEIAEWGWNCALHRLDAKQQQSKEAALREESSKAGYPTAELFAAAALWRNAVRGIHSAYFTDWAYLEPEASVDLSQLYPTMRGKIDLAGLFISDRGPEILVSDLKGGTGVPVKAYNNPQLKLYAFGVAMDLSMLHEVEDHTPVHLQIAQPRVDDGISTWSTTVGELVAWVETEVRPAIAAAISDPKANPGAWCQFCDAGGVCRARADVAGLAIDLDAEQLSPEEVAEWLARAPVVQGFLKRLRERAQSDILAGREIPGWELSRTKGRRKITDEDAAADRLTAAGYRQSQFSQRKLLGVTALDALVGGKQVLADTLGDALGKTDGFLKLSPGDTGMANLLENMFPDEEF